MCKKICVRTPYFWRTPNFRPPLNRPFGHCLGCIYGSDFITIFNFTLSPRHTQRDRKEENLTIIYILTKNFPRTFCQIVGSLLKKWSINFNITDFSNYFIISFKFILSLKSIFVKLWLFFFLLVLILLER